MLNTRETQWLSERTRSILIPTLSNGVSSALIAAHLIGNTLIMSHSDIEGAEAASSIVSTFQCFVIGATFGILSATIVQLGGAVARNDRNKIEASIKIAWLSSLGLGICSSLVFLSTKPLMPFFLYGSELKEKTATCVSDFFVSLAIAPPFYLMSMTNGIIIFQIEKNWIIPLLATISYRIPAIIIGYFLFKTMGITGLGVGATISAIISSIVLQFWFLRDRYKEYNLCDIFNIPNFSKNFSGFLSEGWKLALQRLTEWGNLFIISMIIGVVGNVSCNNSNGNFDSTELVSQNPSIQIMLICNLFSQGIAQAAMMLLKPICTQIKNLKENINVENNRLQYINLCSESYSIFLWSNISGVIANTVCAAVSILLRHAFINLFIKEEERSCLHLYNLANILIFINSLSLIPDAVRQISGGALRGWGDILSPTLANLIIMSGIGIPLGVAGGYLYNPTVSLFVLRIITIILSAVANCHLFYQHRKNDLSVLPQNFNHTLSHENMICIRRCLMFFRPEQSAHPVNSQNMVNEEDGIPLIPINQTQQSQARIGYGAVS